MRKKLNPGLCCLRIVLSYLVVVLHFGQGSPIAVNFLCMCAVPGFTVMSFYLTEKKVLSLDWKSQAGRLRRFAYPLFAWGVVAIAGVVLLGEGGRLSFHVIAEQMLLGAPKEPEMIALMNPPIWFEGAVLYTCVFFMCCCHAFRRLEPVVWLSFLVVLALAVEYSGWIPLERFLGQAPEYNFLLLAPLLLIPYGGVGLILARYHVYERWARQKNWMIAFCLLVLAGLCVYQTSHNTFLMNYGGVMLCMASICIFTCSYWLSVSLPPLWERWLMVVSGHTMGIYCIHFYVGRWFLWMCPDAMARFGIPAGCLAIYGVSFLLAFLLGKIPSSYVRELVH